MSGLHLSINFHRLCHRVTRAHCCKSPHSSRDGFQLTPNHSQRGAKSGRAADRSAAAVNIQHRCPATDAP
jgi:hypothetical protein